MATTRTLDPRAKPIVDLFLAALAAEGLKVTVTSTRRDPAQQARLYANFKRTGCSDGRSRPGMKSCYPAAAPGQSTHATGIAFDLRLDPPLYREAGLLWESLGFTWGGRFDDPIHFDFRPRG